MSRLTSLVKQLLELKRHDKSPKLQKTCNHFLINVPKTLVWELEAAVAANDSLYEGDK